MTRRHDMNTKHRPYHTLASAPQQVCDTAYHQVEQTLRRNGYQRFTKDAEDRIADAIAFAIITSARTSQ